MQQQFKYKCCTIKTLLCIVSCRSQLSDWYILSAWQSVQVYLFASKKQSLPLDCGIERIYQFLPQIFDFCQLWEAINADGLLAVHAANLNPHGCSNVFANLTKLTRAKSCQHRNVRKLAIYKAMCIWREKLPTWSQLTPEAYKNCFGGVTSVGVGTHFL